MFEESCSNDDCLAGCRCPEDTAANDEGQCVKVDQCHCVDDKDDTITYAPNEKVNKTCKEW